MSSEKPFLLRILHPPAYGFERGGAFYAPTKSEIWREFFSRLNLLRTRKAWLPLFSWLVVLALVPPFTLFFVRYFSWPLFAAGFIYSMVLMGTYGTIYLHRYGTHRAYRFRNRFFRFITRNLVIKIIPEEIYVISHHVHHAHCERPGDPYNVHGGWLYCFLADVNHQPIARDLSPDDYQKLVMMIRHTGVRCNSYEQYLKWGSLCHPFWTTLHFGLNWALWFAVFFWIGGMPLAIALFGMAGVWAVGIRTYNYDGHGRGKDRRVEGQDFNWQDLSVNQLWPGYVAGEWHNNHHLYPNGARSGFLPYQVDLPWYYIRALHWLGGISSYNDAKAEFMQKHYRPFRAQKNNMILEGTVD